MAAQYLEFAAHCEGQSPCFVEWALGVAADEEVLAWIDELPGLKKQPNIVFAAARWHGVPAPGPYAGLREALLGDDGTIRATIMARSTQTNEVGRLATLLPAFASVVPSGPVALHRGRRECRAQPVPGPVGLCVVDAERTWSSSDAAPYLPCDVSGPAPLPAALPEVAWRGGIDLNPLDVTDPDAMAAGSRRWSGPRRTTGGCGCGTRSTSPRRPASAGRAATC